tara:strand:- start:757 stop:960 length:204 start_codon:yes stop_codon:yes gene_type:complete
MESNIFDSMNQGIFLNGESEIGAAIADAHTSDNMLDFDDYGDDEQNWGGIPDGEIVEEEMIDLVSFE